VMGLREPPKSVLVTADLPDNAVWLAKSQIELEPCEMGGIFTLTLPEWLALEKGLM